MLASFTRSRKHLAFLGTRSNERSTSEVAEMARIEIPGLYSWNASGGRYDLTQTAYKTA